MSKIRLDDIQEIHPMTDNQSKVFKDWDDGENVILNGSAGSGKTFLALYMALTEVLDRDTPYDRVIIIRSVVPTRDIGFMPGDEKEKTDLYTRPYRGICEELFNDSGAWERLESQGSVEFHSTSFIRGETFNNAIIVVDEMQNLNFHELDSVITRLGQNSRFMMCGDYYQSDFTKDKERQGIISFIKIMENMSNVSTTEFRWEDIVRSGMVRDYIMSKEMMLKKGKLDLKSVS